MVYYICCVRNCRKKSYPGCGLVFHRIPKDAEQRKEWIKVIPGDINSESAVCGYHFKDDDYKTAIRKILKPGVIPSIFRKPIPGITKIPIHRIFRKSQNLESDSESENEITKIHRILQKSENLESEDEITTIPIRRILQTSQNVESESEDEITTIPIRRILQTSQNLESESEDEITKIPIHRILQKSENLESESENEITKIQVHSILQKNQNIESDSENETSHSTPNKKIKLQDVSTQTDKSFSTPKEEDLKRRLKVVTQKLKRRNAKIYKLKSLLKNLKEKYKRDIDEKVEAVLQNKE